MKLSTFLLVSSTLTAFAANSILCRQALMSGSIGPVAFTSIRLGSGILALLPIVLFRRASWRSAGTASNDASDPLRIKASNIWPAVALFSYAIFFSLAYVRLSAAVGALILFPTVQITMIGGSLLQGNKITLLQWVGVVISFMGMLYLLSPGLSAPPVLGTALMIISGSSWGVYSLLGKHQPRPILSTARNFLFSLPAVLVIAAFAMGRWFQNSQTQLTTNGVLLAVISGAVASGIGYILWYLTLRRISMTVASVSQLFVPILVAAGGVIFLDEHLTNRLTVSAILILGGIMLTMVRKKAPGPSADRSLVESG